MAIEFARGVKIIQSAGDQQIGVGVKVLAEFVALVTQIAFDLKFDLLRAVLEVFTRLKYAAKFGVHHIITEVGDVAQHARYSQAPLRHHPMG